MYTATPLYKAFFAIELKKNPYKNKQKRFVYIFLRSNPLAIFLIKHFLFFTFYKESLEMAMVWTDVLVIFCFQFATCLGVFFFTFNWYSRFGVIHFESNLYYLCLGICNISIVAWNVYDLIKLIKLLYL